MIEPLLAGSYVVLMWKVAPFTTVAIADTSSVDGFSNGPTFVLLDDCDKKLLKQLTRTPPPPQREHFAYLNRLRQV